MEAQHDTQEVKKNSRREERLKFSAGGSGTGVLIGCALIAAGIGAAFVAHTARSFRNGGKSSRRNCRKDDRTTDQSVDRIDDDDTVDYLVVGVQEGNTNKKSEKIIVERRETEIMAKLEQDVKIPSIKFHDQDKESSNEGKGEKREEGSEGTGGSSIGSNAEQLWSAEVIEEPETLLGESCSTDDSSVSSQRDTLTESEEESQITSKNFEMTIIITRESELDSSTDGGEDVVLEHNSSTPESLEDIQKTSGNSEIALESLHRHKTYENPEIVMETRESRFIDNMENASDLAQERSFHNVKFGKILQDEINQTWDELVIGNIDEEGRSLTTSKEQEREAPIKEEEGLERRGIYSMELNGNVVHPPDLIDQVKVSESVNIIKEEEEEEEEEERSPIKCKEQEREASIVEEHVRVQEGSEATGNTSEESNDDVIYLAELIDQLEVTESDANKEEEEGSLIKPKEQERDVPVLEEHVTIEEGMKGSTNSFMDSSDDAVLPVELVDIVKVNDNIQEEEEEEHVIVEEGLEGIENYSMLSNSKTIHPAEVSDQVKISVLVNVNHEVVENDNKGSPKISKEQEREASVEEQNVRAEEGLERTQKSFVEPNNEAIPPVELTDQMKVSESINVKDGEDREAPVDKEHAVVEEGSTTNSSMESNDDQVKVSECAHVVSKKEEEEKSPKKSKEQERVLLANEERDNQVIRSEETGNYCKEPNDHLAELIDQVKVLELVRALENPLPCTNLEKGESSVDSSTITIQNADMNSEAVQESVADKEFSTSDVTHYIFQDQEKPDFEKPEISNVKEEIPENEPKPFIQEVSVEGSNKEAISFMSSYRVFILVLLALGVALGLLAFAHPDNLPNIYQQLSQLLFPSGCNVVGEL